MKKRESGMFSAAAAAALAACAAFVLDSSGGEIEVSPGGMSPQEALLAIRAAKAKGDKDAWTVRVKDGFYVLKETLVLTPEDSGRPGAPVLWVGEGDKAVFAGGDRLTGWKDVGGGVWSAPIPRAPDGKPAYFEQLWVNGRRADRARLPNSRQDEPRAGCLDITAASISPVTNAAGEVSYVERVTISDVSALTAVPAEELQWAQMCVVHKWAFSRRIIRSVDAAARTVEAHSCMDWKSWKTWGPGKTLVWFENVRSAFDAPGEWFYDARGGAVLYRPLPGEDMASAEVLAPSSEISRLVELRGDPDGGAYVHDVVFRGISFVCTSAPTQDATRGPTQSYQLQAASGSDGAVTASGVRRISFDGCTFAHTGNYAMRFDDGCTSNSVTGCTMRDLGAGGVWMGARKNHVAAGEQLSRRVIKTLAPRSTAFNRVENCLIREGGRFNPEGTGVAFTHISDSKVMHCEICDFFYTGVSVGWTWGFTGSVAQRNEIAFNRIYDLGKGVMSDMGGVYTLGTSFGTRVHHNVVHDVWACAYGGWALYTDEGSEGITMDHNLCWNTTDGGFHQHYGSGCVIRNNIFAWNRKLGAVRMNRKVVQEIPCSLHFVNNIVVVREGPLVGIGPRGVDGVWAGNLWYDYSGEKPQFDGLDWEGWRACGKEIGGVYADPQFVDADADDFRLKPGSPAFALGFEMWDWSNAGRVRGDGQSRFVGEDPAKYWRLEELSAAPAYRELDDPVTAQPGLKSLMVSGKGPNGSEAEFFCYYGRPEGPVPKGGFPGVVMVHGGGGTAYPNYTKDWIGLGFAVISIDWYNQRPAPGLTNVPPSHVTVPRIALDGGKRQDHVANVANMVLAHSLLRSFPEVNRDRTVFVGLSWGSWYGVCVAAVDDRFKGCVEIYCGDWNPGRKEFFQVVNGRFLPYAKVPMWWAVSTNDQNVTPRTSQDGFDACADFAGAAIVNRLPHSHIGFDFPSVRRMAKCFTGGAKPLPRLTRGMIEGGVASAEILDPGAGVASAKLGYTTCTNLPTWKREWKYAPAKVEGNRISAELPPGAVQCYLSAYEAEKSRFDDLCGSTGFLDVSQEFAADVVVYGSSPAAVTAALKAKAMGLEPVVVSPDLHIGGLSVSGLGFTDSGNTSAIGGLALDFYHRVYLEYMKPEAWRWQKREDFKADGQDTKAIRHEDQTMWTFEPHVAERVFADWLAERRVTARRGELLDRRGGVEMKDGRIVSIRTLSGNVYRGRYFIDATYEGDLMAAAGVPYRVGREDCAEFGEKWNGNQAGVLHHRHHFRDWKISPYKTPGDPSSGLCAEVDDAGPGVRGAGDRRVQAYCYRVCMTDDPRNRIPFAKPDGYDPARYELLARVYAKGYSETFDKFDRIANHKTDTNNHGPFNADYLGGSYEWPEASYARRAEIAKAHRDYQMGLYYFIANDPSVPEDVRRKMSKWGLAKDEFADNGGWPYSLYVREGRRMVGEYVMTEHDCLGEPRHPAQGRPRGPVGMGSYTLDSHNVRRYVTAEGFVQNEGDIGIRPERPYGIDYGALVPRRADCRNLLVPVALSATHTAFGSIRMEPVFMVLGESAATAAAIAAKGSRDVQDVPYAELAARLRDDGQVLDIR